MPTTSLRTEHVHTHQTVASWSVRCVVGGSLILSSSLLSPSAFAQAQAVAPTPERAPTPVEPTPAPTATSPRIALRTNVPIDIAVTGALSATLIVWAAAIKPNLSTPACVICDGANGKVNGLDGAFRSAFKLSPGSSASLVSDIFGYGVGPLTGIGLAIAVPMHDGRGHEVAENLLLVTEATVTYAVLQQGLTALLPRERPEVHAVPDAQRASALASHSSVESFPGGHNGLGFAIAAAGGTVATMRGYRLAPLVWIAGGAVALVTSYLRMAADRHYFTDLTAGAALGIGTGILVPWIFHRPANERASAATRWLTGGSISSTELKEGGRIVKIAWRF